MEKLDKIKCYLLDMDGTIYLGNNLFPGTKEFLQKLEKQKKKYLFLTNNSSKNKIDYQKKLNNLGLKVDLDKIVTSGEVTADYVLERKKDAKVYIVGTASLQNEFKNLGFKIGTSKNDDIDYLVLGFDTSLNYEKLWAAHDLILKGVPYLATNPDFVCPLPEGKTMPDCGSFIQLLKTSTGKEPLVIGKPNTLMINYIKKKLAVKKEEMAMVGDRLYTDMKMAIDAKITGILVLSGETKKSDIEETKQKIDYVFPSIKELEAVL